MSRNSGLPNDKMRCPECGDGIDLYPCNNFACPFGWEIAAHDELVEKMCVGSYTDYYPDQEQPLQFAFAEG